MAMSSSLSCVQCTVKHHMDIINFACMMWNFVLISASLSALCIYCKILPHFDVRAISVAQKLYGLILDVLQYRVRQQARAVHLHMLQHQGALRRGAQGSGQYGDGEGGDNHVDITFLH